MDKIEDFKTWIFAVLSDVVTRLTRKIKTTISSDDSHHFSSHLIIFQERWNVHVGYFSLTFLVQRAFVGLNFSTNRLKGRLLSLEFHKRQLT